MRWSGGSKPLRSRRAVAAAAGAVFEEEATETNAQVRMRTHGLRFAGAWLMAHGGWGMGLAAVPMCVRLYYCMCVHCSRARHARPSGALSAV
jgi:hypothetical protein